MAEWAVERKHDVARELGVSGLVLIVRLLSGQYTSFCKASQDWYPT